MKDIAAIIIIISFLLFWVMLTVLLVRDDGLWEYIRSSKTGICYEAYNAPAMIGFGFTMSPVPDKYCD